MEASHTTSPPHPTSPLLPTQSTRAAFWLTLSLLVCWQVDPEFNIYEVALPWAVERALSPGTATGARTLRSSFLTERNTFQWER